MESFNSSNGRRWKWLLSVGVFMAMVITIVSNYSDVRQFSRAQSAPPLIETGTQAPALIDHDLAGAEGLSKAFRKAAQKVLPAVVVIKAGSSPQCPHCGRAHDPKDDGTAGSHRQQGQLDVLGSGFLVAPSGLVLTNKHVVRQQHKVVVQTADGKQFPVVRVATDQKHDAALLHIKTDRPLPFVSLGDSEKVDIGDWVLTIGSPLELEQTVSAGIISAKNRSFCATHKTRYLQTDAVINPGSSGGPLVALNGTVVGITTAIASDDGGFQGIGFAVPADFVKPLLAKASSTPTQSAVPDSDWRQAN